MSLGVSGNWWGSGSGGGFPRISVLLSSVTPVRGATVTVTGGLESHRELAGVQVQLVRKNSDEELIETLVDETVDLAADVLLSWADILGEPCRFDTDGPGGEYLEVLLQVPGGAETPAPFNRFAYRVMPNESRAIAGTGTLRTGVFQVDIGGGVDRLRTGVIND